MDFKYKFTKEADNDLEEIYDYHEEKEVGLGKRFVLNLFEQIDRIVKRPYSYSVDVENKNIRKIKITDFKYYVYYTIRNPIVLIIAIWHTAREPFDRDKRLPK